MYAGPMASGRGVQFSYMMRIRAAQAAAIPAGARWRLAALLLAVAGVSLLWTPAHADGGVEIISATAVSEFPEGFRFNVEVKSEKKIEEVVVRFTVAGRNTSQYNYLDLKGEPDGSTRAALTAGEYYHRTNTRDRYSPPGTIVNYHFEITDEDENVTSTEPATLIYMDARFEWDSVTNGPVTAFFHGPVEVRARDMAQTAADTLLKMGQILGAETETPLRIIMYNNNAEMLGALSSRSSAISSELITEGQAFGDQNVILLLGNGRRARGTISHELTHVLVARATEGAVIPVPLWLNEGLAEFGNVDPSVGYDRFLEWAVDTGRATPLESLDVFPGEPNLTLVAYGQSRSIVDFMITEYGPEKMAALMSAYSTGMRFDAALRSVYGFDTRGLDEIWRAKVGAEPLPEPSQVRGSASSSATPTPEPKATQRKPLTLADVAAAGAATQATAEPAPEPQTSPEPEPHASPAPESTPAAQPPHSNSGGCSAPGLGGTPEASSAALIFMPFLAFAWLKFRRSRLSR